MQGWRASVALVLGLGIAAQAQTTEWGSFGAAFPILPCQDGWAGCVAYGQHVDAELRRDEAGRGVPADARIGWFDLQATASFSPFVELSPYERGGDAVAVAEEPVPEPVAADPVPVDAVADVGEPPPPPPVPAPRSGDDQREKDRRAAEAAQRAADAERVAQRQRDAEDQRARDAAARDAAARDAAARDAAQRAAAQRDADAAARQREAEAAQRQREAEIAKAAQIDRERQERAALEAKRVADELAAAAKLEADRKAKEDAARQAPPVGDCADTNKLEPYAAMGKLNETLVACLEARVVNDPKMTDKRKASQLLMADAWARSDKKGWEALVKRHLDDIDQSDPDLCFKYALHLSQQGVGRASGVIRWSNVALENRMVWIGDVYTSRVHSLYKVRAAASQALWQEAEEEHRAAGTDETREKVEKFRNLTKVNAREWFEYARDSGKDSTIALQLCMSAAGTADYCEAG